jgi:hypothetical protein
LGVAKAAWVLVVLPLVPGALYLYTLAWDTYMHGRERAVKLGEVAIELQEAGKSSAKDLVYRMQAGLSVGKKSKGVRAEGAESGAVCDGDKGGEDSTYTLNALQSQQHQL